jgi:hypothetical protein
VEWAEGESSRQIDSTPIAYKMPDTGLSENFSARPRIAPPPFSREIVGSETAKLLAVVSEFLPSLPCPPAIRSPRRARLPYYNLNVEERQV